MKEPLTAKRAKNRRKERQTMQRKKEDSQDHSLASRSPRYSFAPFAVKAFALASPRHAGSGIPLQRMI
jgi:hypothetical protein